MVAKEVQEHCLYIGRSRHMHDEEFGTILNRGFNSWVRNLNICIPFVLNFLMDMILYVLFFGLMGYLLFTSSNGNVIDPSTFSNKEIITMLWEGFSKRLS